MASPGQSATAGGLMREPQQGGRYGRSVKQKHTLYQAGAVVVVSVVLTAALHAVVPTTDHREALAAHISDGDPPFLPTRHPDEIRTAVVASGGGALVTGAGSVRGVSGLWASGAVV